MAYSIEEVMNIAHACYTHPSAKGDAIQRERAHMIARNSSEQLSEMLNYYGELQKHIAEYNRIVTRRRDACPKFLEHNRTIVRSNANPKSAVVDLEELARERHVVLLAHLIRCYLRHCRLKIPEHVWMMLMPDDKGVEAYCTQVINDSKGVKR